MTEPINLNKARKALARADAARTAVRNRVRFGRTKAEKDADRREIDKAGRALDQARRDD